MDKQPLVSVIVPVYNAETTIEACANSILSQSHPHLEVWLVNDGSRDQSLALLHALAKQDKRIHVLSQPNGGVAKARNAGLKQATGTYVQFVDSDDILPPEAILRMLNAMASPDCGLVIARYYEVLSGRELLRGLLKNDVMLSRDAFLQALSRCPNSFYFAALWNKLYRRDLIDQASLTFDFTLPWGEDFAFNTRYFALLSSVMVLEAPVYKYTRNPRGLAFTTGCKAVLHPLASSRVKLTLYHYYQKLFRDLGLYEQYRRVLPRYLFGVTISG